MRVLPLILPPLLALTPLADRAGADEAALVREGRAVHLAACATCHGDEGRGDGPTSALLTLPVPDLTGIAARARRRISLTDHRPYRRWPQRAARPWRADADLRGAS